MGERDRSLLGSGAAEDGGAIRSSTHPRKRTLRKKEQGIKKVQQLKEEVKPSDKKQRVRRRWRERKGRKKEGESMAEVGDGKKLYFYKLLLLWSTLASKVLQRKKTGSSAV